MHTASVAVKYICTDPCMDVSFCNTSTSTWTLAAPRTTWECTIDNSEFDYERVRITFSVISEFARYNRQLDPRAQTFVRFYLDPDLW